MAAEAYTHANTEVYVSANPMDSDLTLGQFRAINSNDWIAISPVGQVPPRGIDTNMLSYDTVTTLVVRKAKGITDAGSGTMECARDDSDPGQIKLNEIGAPGYFKSHGFKIVRQDGSAEYSRALVSGPVYPGGRNEDFDVAVYSIELQQAPISSDDLPNNYNVTVTDPSYFFLGYGATYTAGMIANITSANLKSALEAAFPGSTFTVTGSSGAYVVTPTVNPPAGLLRGVGATVVANY